MVKVGFGVVVERILDLLEHVGPMTRSEIEQNLGIGKNTAGSVISRLNRASKQLPKRVYIKAYVYDHEGTRRYPRAVYALGDRADAARPKPQGKENRRRYAEKLKSVYRTNSVFNLGRSVREIREMRKAA